MAMWWLAGGLVSLLTAVGGLICWKSPKARRKLTATRKRVNRRVGHVTRSAWTAHKRSRAATARGQLKAKRRSQPHRLTFGHRRTGDDPTLSRRVAKVAGTKVRDGAGRLADRAKVARANAKAAQVKGPSLLDHLKTTVSYGPGAAGKAVVRAKVNRAVGAPTCGSTNTQDGHPCQNPCMMGAEGHYAAGCYISSHRPPAGSGDNDRDDRRDSRGRAAARTEAQGRRVSTHGIQDQGRRAG